MIEKAEMTYPIPKNEKERLEALAHYEILDTEPEDQFDDIAQLAKQIAGTRTAFLSFVDSERVWFKSRIGSTLTELPREGSFCSHTVARGAPVVCEEAKSHPEFRDLAAVTGELQVQFYLGVPLTTADGCSIGSLCVVDSEPKTLPEDTVKSLEKLARVAMCHLQYRAEAKQKQKNLLNFTESHELLRSFFEISPFMMGVVEINGKEIFHLVGNQPSAQFLNSPAVRNSRVDMWKLGYSKEIIEFWRDKFESGKMDGRAVHFTYPYDLSGEEHWLRATVLFLGQKENGGDLYSYIVEEITEWKRLQSELFNEKERFQLAVEGAQAGLWDWDLRTNKLFYSTRWKEMLGYREDEVKDTYEDWERLVHPDDLERAKKEIDDYIKGKIQDYTLEHRLKCKDGRYLWILSKGACVRDPEGRPFRFTGWHIDIHELRSSIERSREQERIIRDQQAKIVSSAKMSSLGEMAGGIAHEINNPLAIISLSSTQVRDALKAESRAFPKAEEALNTIDSTVKRIGKIVKGLRTFSRSGEGDPFDNVNFTQVISDTLELCREKFRSNGVDLIVDQFPNCQIECRAVQISQVLLNLLNNAFDAVKGQRSPWVRISCTPTTNGILVNVIDSGTGIPANVASRMMEPFYTTKEVGQGTGLGLSISKGIIENHAGWIQYDNKDGNTRFSFFLPRFHRK